MLNNIDVEAIKSQCVIDWITGDVKISDKSTTFNSNSYKKHAKLYKSNKLIDINPIFTNERDKSLILYDTKLSQIILYLI